jgi:hypothetical protein
MIDAIKGKIMDGKEAVVSWVVDMPLQQRLSYVVIGLLIFHVH